uniref:Uncharacterized protein n=1 Tax=Arundo donax TaxID=35708 RepID=A0A0A9H196_ARUDO
MMDGESLFLP